MGNEQPDWLDSMLAQSEPYIQDNGFSEQVKAKIALSPRHKPTGKRDLWMLVSGGAIGSAIAASNLPISEWSQTLTSAITSNPVQGEQLVQSMGISLQGGTLVAAIVGGAWALSVAASAWAYFKAL